MLKISSSVSILQTQLTFPETVTAYDDGLKAARTDKTLLLLKHIHQSIDEKIEQHNSITRHRLCLTQCSGKTTYNRSQESAGSTRYKYLSASTHRQAILLFEISRSVRCARLRFLLRQPRYGDVCNSPTMGSRWCRICTGEGKMYR